MNFIRQIERMQLLNKLIREQRTGSPEELADRLGVSRAKVYLMLEELKDIGIEIGYSKKSRSFYYIKGEIKLKFSFEILDSSQISNNYGGFYFESKLIDANMFFLHRGSINSLINFCLT
jgi:biotin operon repressor